jgi:hypothetical protein
MISKNGFNKSKARFRTSHVTARAGMMETGPLFFAEVGFRSQALRFPRNFSATAAINEENVRTGCPAGIRRGRVPSVQRPDRRGACTAKPRISTAADREERSAVARPGHEEEMAAYFPL